MRRQILFLIVILASAATYAVVLSSEHAVAPPVLGGAPYRQSSPSIASDGDGFFAVWQDERLGIGTTSIVGTRLDRNGNPLDQGGILFTRPKPGEDIYAGPPRVLWTGSEYVVFWSAEAGALQARVSREGEFLGSSATPVADGYLWGAAQIGPISALLTAGRVTLVGPDGVVGTTIIPGVVISETVLQSLIASNGTEFVVATMILRSECSCVDVRAIRIMTDGKIVSTVRASTPLLQGRYAFAASGNRYFFVTAIPHGLTVQTYDVSLKPKSDPTFLSSETTIDSVDGAPSIADGDSFVVAWPQGATGTSILAQRFTRDGASAGPRVTVASSTTFKSAPALARNASERVAAVWSERFDSEEIESDIVARPFAPGGDQLTPGPVTISLAAPSQETAAAAYNGTNYLVAWSEQRGVSEGRRIVAARVSSSGVPIDAPLVVSDRLPAEAPHDPRFVPAVASNGDDFLILWHSATGLSMRRLASDGTWLDSSPIFVADGCGGTPTAAVWNGSEYFVAFSVCGGATDSISGVAISPGGTVGTPIAISPAGHESAEATVTISGGQYLVAWTYTPPYECVGQVCIPPDTDVVGSRVTFGGAVVDTTPIAFSKPHSATENDLARQPSIAGNGNSAVVVWRTDASWFGARVHDGVAATGGLLLGAASRWGSLVPAWDGRIYRAFGSEAPDKREATWTLYEIPIDGPVSLTTPAQVAANSTIGSFSSRGAIRTTSTGGMLLAYPHLVFGPDTGHVSRLFVRTGPSESRSRAIKR